MNVANVLFSQTGSRQSARWHVDTFVAPENSSVNHFTKDLALILNRHHLNSNFSIVEENKIRRFNVLWQRKVLCAKAFFSALDILYRDAGFLPSLQLNLAALHFSCANFWALEILQDCNWPPGSRRDCTYAIDERPVKIMIAVRKVQASDVHARFNELFKSFLR